MPKGIITHGHPPLHSHSRSRSIYVNVYEQKCISIFINEAKYDKIIHNQKAFLRLHMLSIPRYVYWDIK